jgi:hypothetical protein
MSGRFITLAQATTREIILKGINTTLNHQGHNKAPSGHQLQEAEGGGEASEEYMVISPGDCSAYFVGKIRDTRRRTCQVTIQKQKEIAEAEAWLYPPKQVLHTASCYSPYIPEYVGNQQPTASVASVSHSQASWAQLPPPPPLAPTLIHNQ